MDSVYRTLRNSFGIQDFRGKQKHIVTDILSGKDVLVLLPTGKGKSLTYQLPAMMQPGITVVVSPLLSLIEDQLFHLRKLGLPAARFDGTLDPGQRSSLLDDLRSSEPKTRLVYTTPETICQSLSLWQTFQELYRRGLLVSFAIDEAHCVSQWGHSFRESYLRLSIIRNNFRNMQITAFTATATPMVRLDIIKQLRLEDPVIHVDTFWKDNLSYWVKPRRESQVLTEVFEILKGVHAGNTGIIYCLSRRRCEEVARWLRSQGISAAFYHAEVEKELRVKVQNDWISGEVKVIVATISFALGVNKADVRFVMHLAMPKTLEGYYQETGRAGRDGSLSDCYLWYSYQDLVILSKMSGGNDAEAPTTEKQQLYDTYRFCKNEVDCRKFLLSAHLGEEGFSLRTCNPLSEAVCDNCRKEKVYRDRSDDLQFLLKKVREYRSAAQKPWIARQWLGDKDEFNRVLNYAQAIGAVSLKSREHRGGFVEVICEGPEKPPEEFLMPETMKSSPLIADVSAAVADAGTENLKDPEFAAFVAASGFLPKGDADTPVMPCVEGDAMSSDLYQRLSSLRKKIAESEHRRAFEVFSNKTLSEITQKCPKNLEELSKIKGIGPVKLARYGQRFLSELQQICAEDALKPDL
ncbi:MAG: RecQ family ATP-dependent DNA helicase [Sulfobacillus sp.]